MINLEQRVPKDVVKTNYVSLLNTRIITKHSHNSTGLLTTTPNTIYMDNGTIGELKDLYLKDGIRKHLKLNVGCQTV